MEYSTAQKLVAEGLGTALLVATVVGSGIMADRLTDDVALALLGNTIPTGAILFVIITLLSPISGAHFNPAVTLAFLTRRDIALPLAVGFVVAQVIGALAGAVVAHAMFTEPLFQMSTTVRTGAPQWLAEVVATFGLVFTILVALKHRAEAIPLLFGLYITAAYWFTASTSFANPAVAIGRAITDTFSGIRPIDVPMFIIAECIGAILAVGLTAWLLREGKE